MARSQKPKVFILRAAALSFPASCGSTKTMRRCIASLVRYDENNAESETMKFRVLAAITLLAGCATAPSQERLTDPQIAMVMRVLNLGEVRVWKLASDKSTNATN